MIPSLDFSQSKLIVSCQAPPDSPLHHPVIIAAMAQAAVNRGAAGVRIDTPAHIAKVRELLPHVPLIGLWKQVIPGYEVYITPRFVDAVAVAEAGADIIAIDATLRERPEDITELIGKIKQGLGKLVMADVDSLESAIAAVEGGADWVGTTLYGYTAQTRHVQPPGYELLQEMVKCLSIPVICEGGIATPEMAKKALGLGATAVVVGTAITGIELKVQAFLEVTRSISQ